MPEDKLLLAPEVARALRVNVGTISRWCKTGVIKSIKLGSAKRGPLRIPESELKRLLGTFRGQDDAA